MIPFETLNSSLAEVLKEQGIQETDIFNHYSDLYIGCSSFEQAQIIKNSGVWKSCASTFKAQTGSDMENYTICVDIAFGATTYDYNKRYANRIKL